MSFSTIWRAVTVTIPTCKLGRRSVYPLQVVTRGAGLAINSTRVEERTFLSFLDPIEYPEFSWSRFPVAILAQLHSLGCC